MGEGAVRTGGVSTDPLAVAAQLRRSGPVALLDGALDADGLGRWSHVAHAPVGALFAWGRRLLHVDDRGRRRWEEGDPFAAIEARLGAMACDGRAPDGADPRPFASGAVGYLGYEAGREGPAPPDARSRLPDVALGFFADVVAYDRVHGCWHGGDDAARAALSVAAASPSPRDRPRRARGVAWDFDRAGYCAAVERVRGLIREGEVYQVNLSQRLRGRLDEDPFDLYARLRARRPAPLGAYLELGRRSVLSNSPELFLARTGAALETRPIKGTRRRGRSPAEDEALAAELVASEKDAAELTMIVDLMRNDLGRVAATGSVRVPSLKRLVTLPTVHHLVATVTAELAPGRGLADLLHAMFPGGSITGCPKRRAMEVIADLEPCRRGVYTGAIGWLGTNGDLRLNVAIRTLTVEHGRFSLHSGGGIVYDSQPAAEYDETLAKARAFLEALGIGAGEHGA